MNFTRVNLIEAIIYILESNSNETFEIKKLYNKVKNVINYLPDEEIFKFQFIITLKSVNKVKELDNIFIKRDYIITKNSYFSDINVNYNDTINSELELNLNSDNIKKILIDIKTHKEIYDKLDRNIIFDLLIESL